jgi:CysZ protein
MISNSLARTFKSFFTPSIFLTLALPFLIASVLWSLVLFFTWAAWSGFIIDTEFFRWLVTKISTQMVIDSIHFVVLILATLFVFGPLWYLTYLLILALGLFPILLNQIQKKDYPLLERKKGGSLLGSIKNALVGSFLFVFGLVLSLPLWIFTPVGPFFQILITAYLNKKVFIYDVYQDFASKDERIKIQKEFSNEFWIIALISAFLLWIPFINIFAVGLTALMFIHYSLSRLEKLRASA